MGGGLVWQILGEGMDSYNDGYEIVMSQSPSTVGVIEAQSQKMTQLIHSLSTPTHHARTTTTDDLTRKNVKHGGHHHHHHVLNRGHRKIKPGQ
ncbi:hypothetical protein Scep_018921 [Stephania cephalantha]|uniref:Uncharacterized protein n=1 Tax=Stephania cephalantha TaxID=152367 RepID=A0AAP0IA36_9MAGN